MTVSQPEPIPVDFDAVVRATSEHHARILAPVVADLAMSRAEAEALRDDRDTWRQRALQAEAAHNGTPADVGQVAQSGVEGSAG